MKVRDSGMPEQNYWESLFDIAGILNGLEINQEIADAVEVGCGYGTFTLPVARRIRGTLHSFDIEADMVATTLARARDSGVLNVRAAVRDVVASGFDLPPDSVDAVLLFNILHAENPTQLLQAAATVVRPHGRVLAIHWRSDLETPRGPDLSIRPRPEQIVTWGCSVGLAPEKNVLLPPWHFGVVLRRRK
ncbi:class I SAM-dependent methyltransferase [Opitutaceae bacterium EW11]|nr:class I SAM-dependent methyltransferase [Opitutaceae bacterium EW11]